MTRFNFFQLQPWKQTCHASVTCEEFALWGHIFLVLSETSALFLLSVSQSYDLSLKILRFLRHLLMTFVTLFDHQIMGKNHKRCPSLTSNNCCMPNHWELGKKGLCSFNMTLWRGSLKKKHDKSIRLLELVGKCWRLLSYVQKNLAFLWNQ